MVAWLRRMWDLLWREMGLRRGSSTPTQARIPVAQWVKEKLGFAPDEIQARVLSTESKQGILNCTRQWGKSTTAAAKAVHEAYTKSGSLTLVVSPSERQSAELVRKAAEFTQRLGVRSKRDGHNSISLAFPNGARIVGLPGNETTTRGFSAVSLLLVDEAARVTDGLYRAMRPMLAVSGGGLWLMSTPNGKQGFFYDTWERGGPEWERIRVTGYECPRIPNEFLDKERVLHGERGFRQEYLCEFGDVEGGVFDMDLVRRAFTEDVEPLVLR